VARYAASGNSATETSNEINVNKNYVFTSITVKGYDYFNQRRFREQAEVMKPQFAQKKEH